ncbi:unnamed protein product, partial [Rotaria sp. Silwood2]
MNFTRRDIKELYDFQVEQLPNAQSASTCSRESKNGFNYPETEACLLFDILNEHSRWIHSYHSHDSLLENKIDKNLSPEEQHQALEEYETSKRLLSQQSNSPIANNTCDYPYFLRVYNHL